MNSVYIVVRNLTDVSSGPPMLVTKLAEQALRPKRIGSLAFADGVARRHAQTVRSTIRKAAAAGKKHNAHA